MHAEQLKKLDDVLGYLEAWDRLKRVPELQLSEHRDFLLHEHETTSLANVHFNLLDDDGPIWLEVPRLQPTEPPQPLDWLHLWVIVYDDPAKKPQVRESLLLELGALDQTLLDRLGEVPEANDQGHVHLAAEQVQGLADAAVAYIEHQWLPWARKEAPRRKTIELYQRLFKLLKRIEDEGAESPTEVVWGVGQAIWRHNGQLVSYPLLTKRIELELESKTMEIRVRPTEREPRIELDRYAQLQIDSTSTIEQYARALLEQSEDELTPFASATFAGILQHAAANLDERGVYVPHHTENPENRTPPPAKDHLQVTDTWVLFARVRPTDVLAEDVGRLRQQLQRLDPDSELPVAAQALIEGPPDEIRHFQRINFRGFAGYADSNGFSTGVSIEGGTAARELYFPLPYNKEQVAIVERLEQTSGVTVEGPPGTGKSHTIANIICHALAKGERVLVTSYGEPALAVLRDKIPEALQPLVISLLTNEREGLQQLRQSVESIAGRITQINERELVDDIRETEHKIDRLHQTIARIDTELRDWADVQFSEISFVPGLTPLELAKWVIEHEADYDIIPDKLGSDDRFAPRFTEEELQQLRNTRRRLGADLKYFGKPLPALESLPDTESIIRIHTSLQQHQDVEERIADQSLPRIDPNKHEMARKLLDRLELVESLLKSVQGQWLDELRRLYRGQNARAVVEELQDALAEWLDAVDSLSERQRKLAGHAITLPEGADRNAELQAVIERAAMGKRSFGLFDFKKAARAELDAIELDGHRPEEPAQWQLVLQRLATLAECRRLTARWNAMAEPLEAPLIDAAPEKSHHLLVSYAKKIRDARRLAEEIEPVLIKEIRFVFTAPIDGAALLWDMEALMLTRSGLQAQLHGVSLGWAQRTRHELADLLREYDVEPAQKLFQLVTQQLGSDVAGESQIAEEWGRHLSELKRLYGLVDDLQAIYELTELIRSSGAPLYAQHLCEMPATKDGDDPLPANFFDVWKWARAAGHIDDIDGRERIRVLSKERSEAEQALASAHVRVVELKTWLNLKRRISPRVSTALNDYLTAIKKIGKGTGKRAAIHRRVARSALQKSYNAVPCWIMPQHRVSEALPSEFASFDLVIIDEASQSSAWALLALLRGKKALIVGDDNQVTPEAVGMATATMQRLQKEHLKELEYGHLLLPDRSIYEFGFALFAADKLRLTEHFRCVEPIIAYSNRHFYQNDIRPLRIPTASERLDPPLIDVHVTHGYRDPRGKINLPEAQAIVDEIRRIVSNPAMNERTIGVVTLLGREQAHLIQDMVADQIGEEAIQRHDIRFGDARTFQGKEADIVMISLVDDASHLRSLTADNFRQRYNVAASRARDRMYVFHSFRREDCKDGDLRASLLDHLRQPMQQSKGRVEDLRTLCESPFELDFYDEMVRRGYRITPQVRVGQYRIDFVIEGSEDRRLAVELDGDQYHVNRWLEDTQRQRVLERMGWRFWRCWGSSYYRDKNGCIEDLCTTLRQHGIEPIGTADTSTTHLTEFWKLDEHGSRYIYSSTGELLLAEKGHPPEEAVELLTDEAAIESAQAESTGDEGQPLLTRAYASEDAKAQELRATQMRAAAGARGAIFRTASTARAQKDFFPIEPDLFDVTEQRASARFVEVGDTVRYVDTANPGNMRSVQIAYGLSDANSGVINPASPLARAVLDCEEGEEVDVELPAGTQRLKIFAIEKGSCS